MRKKLEWYSVRGLQAQGRKGPPGQRQYAESIVIVRATSLEDARRRAVRIFKKAEYKFLGPTDAVQLFDKPMEGAEVFWSTRISSLSPTKYARKFWDDGKPRSCSDVRGWKHRWYNLDNKHSACYNCKEKRLGQLWKQA